MLKILKKYIGVILLLGAIIIGLLNYKQYGIGWDEMAQYKIGLVNYDYVHSGSKELLTYRDRTYGAAFEIPLIMLEKQMGFSDLRQVFLMRHIVAHLFFLLGAFFFFLLIDFIYQNKLLASIGFLFIVLFPHFYAHSFFNTKDIPFLSMFIICFYLTALAFSKQKIKYFLILGIGVALLINLRVMGILLFVSIIFFGLLDIYFSEKNKKRAVANKPQKLPVKTSQPKHVKGTKIPAKTQIISTPRRWLFLVIFIAVTVITLIASWPYLWQNPGSNFMFALKTFARFHWNNNVLFNGRMILSTGLPWYYVPEWFSITTPILYLISGIFGMAVFLIMFAKKPLDYFTNTKNRNQLIFCLCFFGPILSVIILHSVLYDSWRQMYFIYPPFILMAIFGLNYIFRTKIKKIIVAIIFIYFGYIGFEMVKIHPYQNAYFNEFFISKPPEYIRNHFEIDYWGTAYKQAFEYLLDYDKSPKIDVAVANYPGYANMFILKPEDRQRINIVSDKPKYFITSYRYHPEDYIEPDLINLYSIKVKNNTINTIFKVKQFAESN
mgnify:CR=1 FL=1